MRYIGSFGSHDGGLAYRSVVFGNRIGSGLRVGCCRWGGSAVCVGCVVLCPVTALILADARRLIHYVVFTVALRA